MVVEESVVSEPRSDTFPQGSPGALSTRVLKALLKKDGQRAGEAGYRSDIIQRRLLDTGDRSEPAHQHPLPLGADSGDQVEGRLQATLAAQVPVIGDGEPVGLVADPLHQIQCLGVPG